MLYPLAIRKNYLVMGLLDEGVEPLDVGVDLLAAGVVLLDEDPLEDEDDPLGEEEELVDGSAGWFAVAERLPRVAGERMN